MGGKEDKADIDSSTGTPQCSAVETSVAEVSVSQEAGRPSVGHGLVVVAGDKQGLFLLRYKNGQKGGAPRVSWHLWRWVSKGSGR
jgi:hypothetical protein